MRRIGLTTLCSLLCLSCAGGNNALKLTKVVLFQNGIGYFERRGSWEGQTLKLEVAAHELDDVLKSLTVIDRKSGQKRPALNVSVPASKKGQTSRRVYLRLGQRGHHDLVVSYAAPTPAWKASYRIVVQKAGSVLLQAWAVVNNASGEPWPKVALSLATGSPLTFAVDLHRPTFVSRPDLSGRLIRPVARGAIRGESVRPADRDGDGVLDEKDRCPDQPEDKDGFEDEDGCPDPDNDQDRIPDIKDKCPNEPETYNGIDDDDGCPDKGRVVVHQARIEVLDKVYFGKNSAQLTKTSVAILQAVATTVKGNPGLRIAIQGHTSRDESSPWELSARRAHAVRQALERYGIPRGMPIRAYASATPVRKGRSERAYAANRRVEFLVIARPQRPTPPRGTTAPAAKPPAKLRLQRVVGMTRYTFPGPVTIDRGATSIVSLVSQQTRGDEVYLFRSDANLPGSKTYVQRAIYFENASKLTLQSGPVSVFARGTFVGEGLLTRLHPGENGIVPFALDRSASLSKTTRDRSRKDTIVRIANGAVEARDELLHTTEYRLSPGLDRPGRLWIKHPRRSGYEPIELPAGSQLGPGFILIAADVPKRGPLSVVVKERRQLSSRYQLDQEDPRQLAGYSRGNLDQRARSLLARLIATRRQLGQVETTLDRLRSRMGELSIRATQLRESLGSMKKPSRLRTKLQAQLRKSYTQLSELTAKLSEFTLEQSKVQRALDGLVNQLARIEVPRKAAVRRR